MGSKRVLVVDDDPDILEYVTVLLEDHDYEVVTADGGEAARRRLEAMAVDLLILDVLLPGRSGLDLLLSLRRDQRWCELPVVMLTGHDQVLADGGRSYLSLHPGLRGADAVLGKPLEQQALLSELGRLLAT